MGLENRRGAAAHRFHTTKVGALDLPTYLDTNPTPPLASTRSHTSFDFLFTITSFQVGLFFFLSFFLFFLFLFFLFLFSFSGGMRVTSPLSLPAAFTLTGELSYRVHSEDWGSGVTAGRHRLWVWTRRERICG